MLKLGPESEAYTLAARASTPASADFVIAEWGFRQPNVERRRKRWGLAALVALSLVLGATTFLLVRFGGNNLHTVREGEFYRSAQMDSGDLARAIDAHKIHTVLRLVGADDANRESYEAEFSTCKRLGVNHVVAKMASSRLPWRSELSTLFEELDRIANDANLRPVLVHCSQGSDRTGLVSAIWLHDYRDVPLAEARGQLAFVPYMHVSFGEASAMGRFLDMYFQFTQANPSTRLKIRDWVRLHYFLEKPGRAPAPWYDGVAYSPK